MSPRRLRVALADTTSAFTFRRSLQPKNPHSPLRRPHPAFASGRLLLILHKLSPSSRPALNSKAPTLLLKDTKDA